MKRNNININQDWNTLLQFFPARWQEKAIELRAIKRKRKIGSPDVLMRLLLLHLHSNMSLRNTVTLAKQTGICDINPSDLFKRLQSSEEWLRWMSKEIYSSLELDNDLSEYASKFRIRAVDSTCVSRPGASGSDWRIHYSINLSNLRCDDFELTDYKGADSLKWYCLQEGDLIVGDRGYCKRKEVFRALDNKCDVIFRFYSRMPVKSYRKKPFDFINKLRKLEMGDYGDYNVYLLNNKDELVKGRLVAIKKSAEVAEKEKAQILKEAKKKKAKVNPRTLELAEYFVVFTTANRYQLKSKDVLKLYRIRWQIELCFKRMKSIMGLGQLSKLDNTSCKAWINGKLLIALLVEKIHWHLEFFSPWGYPQK